MENTSDLPAIINWFVYNLSLILKISLVAGLTIVALRFSRSIANRLERRLIGVDSSQDHTARVHTLSNAVNSIIQTVILVVGVLIILSLLEINIAPLIASVGVAGLAISLGAQALIKDYFSGMMILVENQFNVGDEIQLPDVTGTVEMVTLRTTFLRDIRGKLFIIPNGDIRIVANNTRAWRKALVELNLPVDASEELIASALEVIADKINQDPTIRELIIEPIEINYWNNVTEWSRQVRLTAKTTAEGVGRVEIAIRKHAIETLAEKGISMASPVQKVIS